MSLGANFTRVTLGNDPATGGKALFVRGISPTPGDASEIFVAVPHDGELRSALADNPQSREWQATVPEGTSPFQAGSKVFVIGVAMKSAPGDPELWQNELEIDSAT